MPRRIGLAVVFGLLALPAIVRAQYGGGAYAPAPPQAMPMVPAFNPMMTPEWQQAGGNYQAWEQLMMQKMAAQEQAAFRQQLQAYQAWAKANPKEAAALEKAQQAQMNPAAARRKKKATAKTPTASVAAKGAKPAAKAAKGPEDADDEGPEAKSTAPAKAASTAPAAATNPATTSKLKASRQGTSKAAAPK